MEDLSLLREYSTPLLKKAYDDNLRHLTHRCTWAHARQRTIQLLRKVLRERWPHHQFESFSAWIAFEPTPWKPPQSGDRYWASWWIGNPHNLPEGTRNNALTKIAGWYLHKLGLTGETLFEKLLIHNNRYCRPPLDYDDIREIAKSVSKYQGREDMR